MGSLGYTTGRWHPRRGESWTAAEDRRLRRLVRKQMREVPPGWGYKRWWAIANILGRTALGCQARWRALELVDKYRRMGRKKRDRK